MSSGCSIFARASEVVRDAAVARASAQEAEHGADEHADDPATHVVIPRQLVPHAVRQTEHPLHPSAAAAPGTPALPHGHVREHVVEQVGGSLRHPATAAAWTHRPRFAQKRYQSIEAAIITAKSREPAGERATPQKVPELLLDEPRQACSVAQTRGLHAEGLDVIAHDLVERALRGTPRFVGRRGRGHATPEAGAMPTTDRENLAGIESVRTQRLHFLRDGLQRRSQFLPTLTLSQVPIDSIATDSAVIHALRWRFRYRPVCDALHRATCSGVPVTTTRPPAWPPSGPRSMT